MSTAPAAALHYISCRDVEKACGEGFLLQCAKSNYAALQLKLEERARGAGVILTGRSPEAIPTQKGESTGVGIARVVGNIYR